MPNIARNYMSGLERGVRNPTVLILDRLAKVLMVPVAEIVADSPGRELPKNLLRGRHVEAATRKRQQPRRLRPRQ